jgi:hypothetical protein
MIIEWRRVRVLLPHHRRVTPPTRRTLGYAEALAAEGRDPATAHRDAGGIRATAARIAQNCPVGTSRWCWRTSKLGCVGEN